MEGLKAALETTKQVIALSTGVITITVTFLEKIVQPGAGTARHVPGMLKGGWICFGVAVLFAVWTLMAITGSMSACDRSAAGLPLNSIEKRAAVERAEGVNVRVPALLMLLFFASGVILTVITGFWL